MKGRRRGTTFEENARRLDAKAKEREALLNKWLPKTKTGKLVKDGQITSYEQILTQHLQILEPEIVDFLIPDLQEKTIEVRKTTRVTRSGRNFRFRVGVLIGDGKGLVGLGIAKDKEKWPAVRKALKKAKLNLMNVRRGCGSWECTCGLGHSIPFAVDGKSASVKVKLMPAPRGTGLVAGDNIKDVFKFVGVEDVLSNTYGGTATKLNFVRATINALSKTTKMKISKEISRKLVK
jgi:small subunit ribosomal protein S5